MKPHKTKTETALGSTISMAPCPIKDVVIHSGRKEYTYKPQEDITTFELATILRMFPFFTIAHYNGYDFEAYILENKLERHFEVKDNETT